MELGFIHQEAYDPDQSIFTLTEKLGRFQKNGMDKTVLYSAMIEGNESDKNFPVCRLGSHSMYHFLSADRVLSQDFATYF